MVASQEVVPTPGSEDKILDDAWVGKIEVETSGSTVSVGLDKPITKGIPVVGDTSYKISLYAKAAASGKSGSFSILWYDKLGVEIPNSKVSKSISFATSWAQQTNSVVAPVNAVYAGIEVLFSSTGIFYLDRVSFSTDMATVYKEPRMLDIFLEPNKVNFISNPSVETNTTGWSGTNTTLSKFDTTDGGDLDTPPTTPVVTHPGPGEVVNNRYLLKSEGSDGAAIITPTVLLPEIIGGKFFSWSTYAQSDDSTVDVSMNLVATVRRSWEVIKRENDVITITFNSSHPFKIGNAISITTDAVGSSFNGITQVLTTENFIGIDTITFPNEGDDDEEYNNLLATTTYVSTFRAASSLGVEVGTDWVRLSTSLYIPDYWQGNLIYLVPSIAVEENSTVYFEAAQFEEGQFPSDYFDGSLYYQGCAWQGTAHASQSAKYTNRRRRLLRLGNEIESYLPINTVYQIRDYLLEQSIQLSV
jgi:hypothetical protein